LHYSNFIRGHRLFPYQEKGGFPPYAVLSLVVAADGILISLAPVCYSIYGYWEEEAGGT